MASRVRVALVAWAIGALSCSHSNRTPLEIAQRKLDGATVATVGDQIIATSIVSIVAQTNFITPRAALDRLIEDALMAEGARKRGIAADFTVAHELRMSHSRQVARRLSEEAFQLGPPSNAEVTELSALHWAEFDCPESMLVIHAVLLRPKKEEQLSDVKALAKSLREVLAHATTDSDFEKLATDFPHGKSEMQVQRLPPFVADGRVALPGETHPFYTEFTSAAFTLKVGSTSEVIESPAGFHIIRPIERKPAFSVPWEERRARFTEEAVRNRSRKAYEAILERQGSSSTIEFASDAEALMQRVAQPVAALP